MPEFKSLTLTSLSDTPKKITFRQVWTEASGKTGSDTFSGPEDGTLHTFQNSKNKASFTPAGTGHFVDEDGGVSDVKLALAPDDKTMTMTGTYKAKDGAEHHTRYVFDRVK